MAKEIFKITRRLDELRRFALPADVKAFGWNEGTALDIFIMDDETVVLKAFQPCCKMCGASGSQGLIVIKTGCICFDCFNEAKKA